MPASTRTRRAALTVQIILSLIGLTAIGLAIGAGHDWADRHFLPAFSMPRAVQIGIIDALRVLVGLIGVALLLWVAPRTLRAVRAGRGSRLAFAGLSSAIAVVAALGVVEGVLHTQTWRANQEHWGPQEPLRQPDCLLGWSFVPNHHGTADVDARAIDYATDALGARVAAAGGQVDPARPTIVFAGESILFGYGLQWTETIPAQVQAMTGVQAANLSVNAFAPDQIYMRLRRVLPRFARPVAVVVPFVPLLFDRMLDQDRPWLDAALRWHAASPPDWRLVELARRVLRYRSEEGIDSAVVTTQAVLRATIVFARSRGAVPLIVVPQLGPEDPTETAIRHRVLDDAHIPYLLVPLDAAWRLQIDRHPNATGAHAIAVSIARTLRAQIAIQPSPGE